MVDDGTLYASVADGTTQNRSAAITGVTITDLNIYEIVLTGTTSAEFLVNGVSKATLNANMPTANSIELTMMITGTALANRSMHLVHPGILEITNIQST